MALVKEYLNGSEVKIKYENDISEDDDISNLFCNCKGLVLKDLDIINLKVNDMTNLFCNCKDLDLKVLDNICNSKNQKSKRT